MNEWMNMNMNINKDIKIYELFWESNLEKEVFIEKENRFIIKRDIKRIFSRWEVMLLICLMIFFVFLIEK